MERTLEKYEVARAVARMVRQYADRYERNGKTYLYFFFNNQESVDQAIRLLVRMGIHQNIDESVNDSDVERFIYKVDHRLNTDVTMDELTLTLVEMVMQLAPSDYGGTYARLNCNDTYALSSSLHILETLGIPHDSDRYVIWNDLFEYSTKLRLQGVDPETYDSKRQKEAKEREAAQNNEDKCEGCIKKAVYGMKDTIVQSLVLSLGKMVLAFAERGDINGNEYLFPKGEYRGVIEEAVKTLGVMGMEINSDGSVPLFNLVNYLYVIENKFAGENDHTALNKPAAKKSEEKKPEPKKPFSFFKRKGKHKR